MFRRFRLKTVGLGALALVLAVGGLAGMARAQAAQNPPVVGTAPTITGQAVQGATLTATGGQWTGAQPMTFAFQWRRCGTGGGNCVNIAGATAATYVLTAGDVGRRLRVRVTATNADGSVAATSAPTAVVAAGPSGQVTLADGKVSIPASSVSLPQRLVISELSFTPTVIRSREPVTARFRITDTRGYVVRDALVYVVAVPYGRIQSVQEQATGQDGWVSVALQPTAQLPLRRGYSLTMFVRARKTGDNLLAGVSTRRLVQVRTNAPA